MAKEKQVATVPQYDAPAEWGSREEIVALADRIQFMIPGELNRKEAMALAQYSAAVDANPFRGEVYAYTDKKGKLILVEGYKLLVRWAKKQSNFTDRYTPIPTKQLPEGAIGFTCHILRHDSQPLLQTLIQGGANWEEALTIVETSATGIVLKSEMWSTRYNKPIAPPKTWTWEQVAKKRALKAALKLAFAAPSPREIAAQSWIIDDIQTAPEDWSFDASKMTIVEAEANAKYNAQARQRKPLVGESAAQSIEDLWGPSSPLDENPAIKGEAEPEEALDTSAPPASGNGRAVDAIESLGDLWTACLEDFGLDRSHALKELGVTSQEHLSAQPRDLYRQIAAARPPTR